MRIYLFLSICLVDSDEFLVQRNFGFVSGWNFIGQIGNSLGKTQKSLKMFLVIKHRIIRGFGL